MWAWSFLGCAGSRGMATPVPDHALLLFNHETGERLKIELADLRLKTVAPRMPVVHSKSLARIAGERIRLAATCVDLIFSTG
jgi:hypothetical protein